MQDAKDDWLNFISDERLRRWVDRKRTERLSIANLPDSACTPQAFVEEIIREYAFQGVGICDSKEEEDGLAKSHAAMVRDSERGAIRDAVSMLGGDVNRRSRP